LHLYHRLFSSILEKSGFSRVWIWGHFGDKKCGICAEIFLAKSWVFGFYPVLVYPGGVPKLSPPKNTFIKIPPPVDEIRIFGTFLGISWIFGEYLGNIYENHTFQQQISGILRINICFIIKTLWIHIHCHHTILHTPTSILIPSSCFSPSSCPNSLQHSTE